MALINNCLCVLSLRTGGYISGVYAIVYYALHIILETWLATPAAANGTSTIGRNDSRILLSPSSGTGNRTFVANGSYIGAGRDDGGSRPSPAAQSRPASDGGGVGGGRNRNYDYWSNEPPDDDDVDVDGGGGALLSSGLFYPPPSSSSGDGSSSSLSAAAGYVGVFDAAGTTSAAAAAPGDGQDGFQQLVSLQQHIIDVRNESTSSSVLISAAGNPAAPSNGSFIDYDSAKAQFMMTVLFPAGIVASALVLAGVYWNKRFLFVPWLLIHPITVLFDLIKVFRIFFFGKVEFEPVPVFTFSGYTFLTAVNVYSFLCVISQYQELKAGRGRPGCQTGSPTAPIVIYDKRSASHPTTLSAGSTTRRTGLTTADGSKATPTPTNSHANPGEMMGYSPDHVWSYGGVASTRATAKIYLSPEDAIKMTATAAGGAGTMMSRDQHQQPSPERSRRGSSGNHLASSTAAPAASLLLAGNSGGGGGGSSVATTPTAHPRKQVSFLQPSFASDSATDDQDDRSDDYSSAAAGTGSVSVTAIQVPVILLEPNSPTSVDAKSPDAGEDGEIRIPKFPGTSS